MPREIKFRGWNGQTMIGWETLKYAFKGFLEESGHPVMQYSSFKDKHGIEIYEGDIIEYSSGGKAKVVFHEGAFMGYDGYASSSEEAYLLLKCPEETPFEGAKFEVEVIGNIYENKDLLE